MKRVFSTSLVPADTKIAGGFKAGGSFVDLHKWADELFGAAIPGPWLTCYMLRRFGWPNSGSDSHKELCAWVLSTPIPGLFLSVSPYLGDSNFHFGVRFTEEVGRKLMSDPGRESFQKRRAAAISAWWNRSGRKKYTLGTGTIEGDEDELVQEYGRKDGKVYGLWRRRRGHSRFGKNALPTDKYTGMVFWWLGEFLKEKHPEVLLPKMTRGERTRRVSRFGLAARHAVRATLRDLLNPTSVRDLSFNVFGDTERTPEAVARVKGTTPTGHFAGAGYIPDRWLAEQAKKERQVAATAA